jgi:uncharacterized circularly permuted ATP-grasp superfamily protein
VTAPLFSGYAPLSGTFDEILAVDGPRPTFARVLDALDRLNTDELARLQQLAEQALLQQGVTFSVYSDNRGTEKIFPFCLVPRLVAAADFAHVERGLEQRLRALGAFLDDVYGDQRILAAGVIPPRWCSARSATSRPCAG